MWKISYLSYVTDFAADLKTIVYACIVAPPTASPVAISTTVSTVTTSTVSTLATTTVCEEADLVQDNIMPLDEIIYDDTIIPDINAIRGNGLNIYFYKT